MIGKKILILGLTGGTGREVVSQALQQGHEVTAFARRPDRCLSARECQSQGAVVPANPLSEHHRWEQQLCQFGRKVNRWFHCSCPPASSNPRPDSRPLYMSRMGVFEIDITIEAPLRGMNPHETG